MSEAYDASGIQVLPQPDNLYALIRLIRTRPGLYLGSLSISALHHFINGYNYACHAKGMIETETPDWAEFHEFARRRTGFGESTGGWCYMILSFNGQDEAKALAMFFEIFEDFVGPRIGASS